MHFTYIAIHVHTVSFLCIECCFVRVVLFMCLKCCLWVLYGHSAVYIVQCYLCPYSVISGRIVLAVYVRTVIFRYLQCYLPVLYAHSVIYVPVLFVHTVIVSCMQNVLFICGQ